MTYLQIRAVGMQQLGAVGVPIKNELEGLVSMLFSSVHGCETVGEVDEGDVLVAKLAPEIARRLQCLFVNLQESFVAGLHGDETLAKYWIEQDGYATHHARVQVRSDAPCTQAPYYLSGTLFLRRIRWHLPGTLRSSASHCPSLCLRHASPPCLCITEIARMLVARPTT